MDEKKFISSKAKRIFSFGKTLVKASGEYALAKGKMKAEELLNSASEVVEKNQQSIAQIKAAKELIAAMGSMKGGVMKIGQMLSITDDMILPKEVTDMFKVLQKETSYMPKEQVDEVFLKSFQKLPTEIFVDFDYKAIAAASIGQVHKASLPSGEVVAIKIQYPNIEEVIVNDMKNFDHIKGLIKTIIPGKPDIDPIIEELKKTLVEECDYIQERKHMDMFRELLKDKFPKIKIPETYPDFCSAQVLTMEFVEGATFDETLDWSQEQRDELGQLYYPYYLFTVFQNKHFHSDPQHGNFLFRPGEIILLDFGSTKVIEPDFMKDYMKIYDSLLKNDIDQFRNMMMQFNIFKEELEIEHYKKFFTLLQDQVLPLTEKGSFTLVEGNPFKSFFDYAVTIPVKHRGVPHRHFILLDRANVGMYMKLRKWGARINWLETQKKHLAEFNLPFPD